MRQNCILHRSSNVTGASVCLGSAKNRENRKDLTYEKPVGILGKKKILADGVLASGEVAGTPTKSNLVLVTKAAKDKPFDLEELKPLRNLKLKDILK